jgi:energy-coupling factor transport system substrate-specific component
MRATILVRRALGRAEGRFLVAGGIAALVNWLARFPIELVLPYFVALLVATAIGMTCGFLLYRGWVFPGSSRPMAGQIRDFVLVNLAGQASMLAVATVARELMLLAHVEIRLAGATAHALGIAIGAVVNYLGHRDVTFATAASKPPPDGQRSSSESP